MPRPLFSVVLFLAGGMVCARWVPNSWHPIWLLLPIGLVSAAYGWLLARGRSKMSIVLLLALFTGLFYAYGFQWKNQPTLDQLVDHPIRLQGSVQEDPVQRQDGVSFRLTITEVLVGKQWQPVQETAEVRLQTTQAGSTSADFPTSSKSASKSASRTTSSTSIRTKFSTSVVQKSSATTSAEVPPIQYGDLLQLEDVLLEKPAPARNPGAFDAQRYDAEQGIAYSVKITPKNMRVLGLDDRGVQGRIFYPIRRRLLKVIQQEFSQQNSAVVAGLVLGITDQIDPEVMDSFRLLGVVHILAVSGANVALLIMPMLGLLKRLRLSARKRYVLAVLLVLLFGGVTGGGASVLRACAMSVMWCVGRMASRETDALTSWSLAALLTLLANPLAVSDLGFQLTYLITLGMLVLPQHLRPLFSKLPDRIAQPLILTLTAELISVPLLLTINPAYTPLSLLANLYIIPLLEVLVPLAVVTILLGLLHPVVAYLPAFLTKWLLILLIDPLTYAGQAGWLVRHYRAPAVAWLCAYYVWWLLFAVRKIAAPPRVAALFLQARKWGLALGLLVFVGTVCWQTFGSKNLRVVFIDVGQGDSSLIEMPKGSVWIVDGGGIPGAQHQNYDVGQKVVVPAIAAEGIDTIDVMVMTHADEDHVRGLLAVLKSCKVKQVVVSDVTTDKPFYQELLHEVRSRHIPLVMAQAGQVWTPEPGVTVTFWNPPLHHYRGTRSDTNSNSVVFSLQYGVRSLLFTADYEGEVEPKLPIRQHVDVLKVAHHGSGYSTTTPFLQRITPTQAVVSVGAHNRYGHPNKGTLQRLHDIGANIWRTDRQGAIVCETDGKMLHMYSWLDRGT